MRVLHLVNNEDVDKISFLQEMHGIRSLITGPWMILGDFNLILQAQDKNNDLLNRRLMNKFRRVVDDLDLKEVHLNGRAFTWTSAKERPTLGRIDRVFVSIDWEHLFPDCFFELSRPRLLIIAHSYCRRCFTLAPRKTSGLNPSGRKLRALRRLSKLLGIAIPPSRIRFGGWTSC